MSVPRPSRTAGARPTAPAPSALPAGRPAESQPVAGADAASASESLSALFRELGTGRQGLGQREAQRRLIAEGPNALPPAPSSSLLRDLITQLFHPLALLLWAASALAAVAGTPQLSVGIVGVIILNAVFALVQERQAQRAVRALSAYLPETAIVRRNGELRRVDAVGLVRGDIILLEEGDRIPADAKLVSGSVQLDMSALTGESAPVERAAGRIEAAAPPLSSPDLVFSGTLCTAGAAEAVVRHTGSYTEIGRIAALTQHVRAEASPLERQVRRVAWLIAGVGVVVGVAFLPLGLVAGLSLHSAVLFAIGLLVANVPEGLLPTITLALASGVRDLARKGAVIKRLSAIETLGSTTVICTDKTGTLTQNRMTATAVWTWDGGTSALTGAVPPGSDVLAQALAKSSVVRVVAGETSAADPTDVALNELATSLGADADVGRRDAHRRRAFRFDPGRRLASTVQVEADGQLWVYARGAPESVAQRCRAVWSTGGERPIAECQAQLRSALDRMTAQGLRVIAVARRPLDEIPGDRDLAERDLTLLGLVALLDPPRPEVAAAVQACHDAGIRIIVVTGDNGRTAAHIAREVGIGAATLRCVDGPELDAMSERELDAVLMAPGEIVFSRSSPEAKLRIADALRAQGHVVAMTGDGVNDAPALHRADIGVAMGLAGTEVAREAAAMVLSDDNFASIVRAIRAGRQVFDNVRKFILYIFAHAVPEVVPFVVFALSGGAVPLPLTVMQILAIDLGTETLPALALGREPPEPGIMRRGPRGRGAGVIDRSLLWRAWGRLGIVSAALVMSAFFFVLWRAGWHPGDPVGSGHRLHHAYLQATTATWAGLVACQVGTAFASRTDRVPTREVGWFSNRMLLWGIAFELAFAAAVIWLRPLQVVFGTAGLPIDVIGLISVFPVLVWGVDELHRRRRGGAPEREPEPSVP